MMNCNFLSRYFYHISFGHCPREVNTAAHVLASHGESCLNTVWDMEPSDVGRGMKGGAFHSSYYGWYTAMQMVGGVSWRHRDRSET